MDPELVRVGDQSIAVRRSGQAGPAVLLVHGNSCSSRCYQRQLESELSNHLRLVAMDLPGHGDSSRAPAAKATYTLAGHAAAVVATAETLGIEDAVFVGWSLGGHVLLEASGRLPRAAGFLVFGAPPLASNADIPRALSGNPAFAAAFREHSTDDEVRALVAMFFRPGAGIPPLFIEDFRRTDERARSALAAAVGRNEFRDEVRAVAELKRPLAVLHGVHDTVANRSWIAALTMPTLWRGAVQDVPDAGHAAHWENPGRFNRLLHDFALECSTRA